MRPPHGHPPGPCGRIGRALGAGLALAGVASGQFATVQREVKLSSTAGGFAGPLANDYRFGVSVADLGDFDGDGTRDLAVGSHRADIGGEERGAIWLLLMNPDGTVREHRQISSVAGGLVGPLDDHDRFGISIAPLGDLDLDGTVDLAVGAYRDDDGGLDCGCVYVLFLAPDGTVRREQKIGALSGGFSWPLRPEDSFGWSAEAVGDLDGDGVVDLAVGATRDDGPEAELAPDFGAVYVLFLRPDGTVRASSRIAAGPTALGSVLRWRDRFGSDLARLEDADGDGVEDLAVGAFGEDPLKCGRVFVLHLQPDGSVKDHREIGLNTGGFTGALNRGDRFGISLASDDFDGDGLLDLVVGAVGDDDGGSAAGAIWVCLLDPLGRVRDFEKISPDFGGFGGLLEPSDNFGISCTTIGDLDRDGAVDLAVGAYQDDDGGYDRGATWVLFRDGTGAPVADFVSGPPSGYAPLDVSFSDRSSGAITTWTWDFGDGTGSSEASPIHTYTTAGVYEVTLTVQGPLGVDSLRRQRAVVVLAPVAPTAAFAATPESGPAPLQVAFTDLSTGTISAWRWDFGDGNTSTQRYPKHLYATPGAYTVSLAVTGRHGPDTETRAGAVEVIPLAAAFEVVSPGGVAPVTVQFLDQSLGGPTSWSWSFGDGTSSTVRDPSHVFEEGGTFSVALTVTRNDQTSTAALPVEIAEPPPAARFSVSVASGAAPLLVSFTDRSTGNVTSWQWDFGDGSPHSQERSPSHTYWTPGVYTVRLRVTSAGGADIAVRRDLITVTRRDPLPRPDAPGGPPAGPQRSGERP